MDPRYLRNLQQGFHAPSNAQPSSAAYYGTPVHGNTLEEEPSTSTSSRTTYPVSTPPISSPMMSSAASHNDFYGTAPPSSTTSGGVGLRQRRTQLSSEYAYYDQDNYTRDGSSSTNAHTIRSTRKMVRKLDIFTKVEKDMTIKTERGGMITIISYCVMAILVLAEIITWKAQNSYPIEHVTVETSLGKKMRINLNITFPSLACEDIHVDALDVAGDAQVNIEGDTFIKRRLHLDGSPMGETEMTAASRLLQRRQEEKRNAIVKGLAKDYCGPCYGAQKNETDCCQTCDDVIAAYKEKKWNSNDLLRVAEQCIREGRQKIDIKKISKDEGCNLDGYMLVNRVAGNFHIAMGESVIKDGRLIHQFLPEDAPNFNVSHIIHELSFGLPIPGRTEKGALDGMVKLVTEDSGTTGLFQYFVKVVPTYYKSHKEAKQAILETNRFFVTERFRPLMTEILDEHYELGTEHQEKVAGIHASATTGKGGIGPSHHKVQNAVLPGVFFIYDMYPFALEISKTSVPLSHLLIRLMAVVGGVITITGLIISVTVSNRPRSRSV